MNKTTTDVLSKLKFWFPRPVTGQTLADACGVDIRQIQEAMEILRTEPDEKGRRYFVIGNDAGYRLTEDVNEAREYAENYKRRARTYFVNSQGMDAAIGI